MLAIIKLIAVAYFSVVLFNIYCERVRLDMADGGEWGVYFRKACEGYSVMQLSLMVVVPVSLLALISVLLVTRLEAAVGFVGAMPKMAQSIYGLNEKAYKLLKLQAQIDAGEIEKPDPFTREDWMKLAKWIYFSAGVNILVKEGNKMGYDLKPL